MLKQQFGHNVQSRKAFIFLIWVIILGLISNIVFPFQSATWGQGFSVGVVGLMYSFASLLSGCFIGFLFGIPRMLQQNAENQEAEKPTTATKPGVDYRPNTNLEQISDWLTKILVGVGLTQIGSIPARLKLLSEFMAPGLGNFPSSNVFAVTLLVFFSISGFLFGYSR